MNTQEPDWKKTSQNDITKNNQKNDKKSKQNFSVAKSPQIPKLGPNLRREFCKFNIK